MATLASATFREPALNNQFQIHRSQAGYLQRKVSRTRAEDPEVDKAIRERADPQRLCQHQRETTMGELMSFVISSFDLLFSFFSL